MGNQTFFFNIYFTRLIEIRCNKMMFSFVLERNFHCLFKGTPNKWALSRDWYTGNCGHGGIYEKKDRGKEQKRGDASRKKETASPVVSQVGIWKLTWWGQWLLRNLRQCLNWTGKQFSYVNAIYRVCYTKKVPNCPMFVSCLASFISF